MSRIWSFAGPKDDGARTTPLSPPALPPGQISTPDQRWDPEPDDDYDAQPEHYVARPVRPISAIAARFALWSAVALGAVGGVASLVTVVRGEDPEPEQEVDESLGVPAPVAGVAELAVERWLTASEDSAAELETLFAEMPDLEGTDTESMEVLDVQSVAGMRLEKGYWSVTVAARVVEAVGDVPPPPVTWYVEVGIVGDVEKGLAALTTPAVVPPPRLVESPWRTSARNVEAPGPDDRVAATVEGFLNALLAGDGDPGRYLAPRVDIPAVRPAPFASVELEALSVEEIADDEIRIWALAELTTAAEGVHVAGYEIKARRRIDRWEILSIWGAPAVDEVPPPEDPDESDSGQTPPEPESTTTTLLDDGLPLDDPAGTEEPADTEDPADTTDSTTTTTEFLGE